MDQRFRAASPGHSPDDLLRTSVFDLYSPEHQAYSRMGFARALADPTSTLDPIGAVARTALVRRADGSYRHVESFPTVLFGIPEVNGLLLEWTPIPDRATLTEAIDSVAGRRPVRESLDRIVELAESYLVSTQVGVVAVIADRWAVLSTPGGRPEQPLADLLPPPGHESWGAAFIVGDDRYSGWTGRGVHVAFRPVRGADGMLLAIFVFVRSGIERLANVVTSADNMCDLAFRLAALTLADELHRVELTHAAEIDPLTGLANRVGLTRRFDEQATVHPHALVLYLDLDDFKPINDRFGHTAGDFVLARIGARLRSTLTETDITCRLGGDEFVAVCFAPWTDDGVASVIGRLSFELERPIEIPTSGGTAVTVQVGVSVGSALGATTNLAALMRQADDALYAANAAARARARLPPGEPWVVGRPGAIELRGAARAWLARCAMRHTLLQPRRNRKRRGGGDSSPHHPTCANVAQCRVGRPQRGAGGDHVVDHEDTPTARAGLARKTGPWSRSIRARPVWAGLAEWRSSRRRQGRPSCAATRRATTSA